MTSALQLYTGPLSMFGMKAEIALREKGLAFERIEVAYSATAGYEPKHPEVIRANPKRQVPVLVDGDLAIFDSTQIFEYLEDIAPLPALWPQEPRARARARMSEHTSDEIYFSHVVRLMGQQDLPIEQQPRRAASPVGRGLSRNLENSRFVIRIIDDQSARRHSHSGFHPRPVRSDLHAVARLVRCRRHQGRASGCR